jgi:hypothetical protein
MERQRLRNSYAIALGKLLLFLIIFCFLVEFTKGFISELKNIQGFQMSAFYISILSCFIFYTFIADLNGLYNKLQNFFFRNSFFSLIIPSLLILLALGYFIIPKLLNFSFHKNTFVFLGGFIFTVHLISIARQTKASTFIRFINYLFIFSILYIINLVIFGIYLKVAFKIPLGEVVADSISGSFSIVKNIFTQIFK